MELKFWVPGPALPLMLYDLEPCALCRLKGRLFVTLVTLSLAMGYSWPIQGLALASLGEKILTSDEPYELEHRSFGPKMELFLFFRPHGVSFPILQTTWGIMGCLTFSTSPHTQSA